MLPPGSTIIAQPDGVLSPLDPAPVVPSDFTGLVPVVNQRKQALIAEREMLRARVRRNALQRGGSADARCSLQRQRPCSRRAS